VPSDPSLFEAIEFREAFRCGSDQLIAIRWKIFVIKWLNPDIIPEFL
jgi:hypothetical protein